MEKEQKPSGAGSKRFIIPSQEPQTAPVRSLFHAPSSVPSTSVSGGSYADYIFKKEPKVPERKIVDVNQATGSEQKSLVQNSGSQLKIQEEPLSLQQKIQEASLQKSPQIVNRVLDSGDKSSGGNGGSGAEEKPGDKNGDPVMVDSSAGGAPAVPALKSVGGKSSIIVSTRQRGNPLLKHVRNIPWEFGDIVPDYLLGDTCCAFFLSLRYHNLNPEYIHTRLKTLGQTYALRVLLVQVDVKDPHFTLKELAKICILSDLTLILSWSPEEAARYLETYKCYEQKPADALKERTDSDFMSRMTDCLTTVKSVNKTDSCTLLTTFGTLSDLANASREDLSLCPGLGPQKAKRLYDALHEPFLKTKK